jgi:DNA helicase-2/ATP-dependent DNA helicase PcrA
MDSKELDPIEQARSCIDNNINFVLHGGAGSGKTETLKELLRYVSKNHPMAKVVCITHTNIAADEIKMRIDNSYPVLTIHSFLYDLIKGYKKNIKAVIHNLFIEPFMIRAPFIVGMDEVDYKKSEHEKYKKIYGEYADKLFSYSKMICDKAIGKREYDKDPVSYNSDLNKKIGELNEKIISIIQDFDYSKIEYNQTKFNSFKEVSFGHDGLLDIVHLLFNEYPVLKKIISDKFDYIFIDEYQDTRASIIKDFIAVTQEETGFSICLFGDSMQSIYGDGIGNVDHYIGTGELFSIPKKDNYRCSYEVLDLINTLRLDNIEQKVALKKDIVGNLESENDRHGNVSILYSIYDNKPTSRSSIEDKEIYLKAVDILLSKAIKIDVNANILILTNKAIAKKENFETLYKVFDDRYAEVSDRMDDYLKRTQIMDLCELCYNYISKNYNFIISSTKKSGYTIQYVSDKIKLKKLFDELLNAKVSLNFALNFAFENKLLKQTETFTRLQQSNERYLKELSTDQLYKNFKKYYENGENTFTRIKDSMGFTSEEEFDDYKKRYLREQFIYQFFSDNLSFSEALNYYKYLNENSKNITNGMAGLIIIESAKSQIKWLL